MSSAINYTNHRVEYYYFAKPARTELHFGNWNWQYPKFPPFWSGNQRPLFQLEHMTAHAVWVCAEKTHGNSLVGNFYNEILRMPMGFMQNSLLMLPFGCGKEIPSEISQFTRFPTFPTSMLNKGKPRSPVFFCMQGRGRRNPKSPLLKTQKTAGTEAEVNHVKCTAGHGRWNRGHQYSAKREAAEVFWPLTQITNFD